MSLNWVTPLGSRVFALYLGVCAKNLGSWWLLVCWQALVHEELGISHPLGHLSVGGSF